MQLKSEKGFVLPLALLLMIFLTLSGTSFLQLGFLEQRMTMIEINNQSAFYLANAGIERTREAMKIPDDLTWTTVLQDTSQRDSSPPCLTSDPTMCLCPTPTSSKGCIIPPFGATVSSPGLAFEGTFDHGQYQVRAFNNESGTIDTDQILTFRALGTVNGQQKLIETNVLATSNLNLLNCIEGQPCPEKNNGAPTVCDVNTTPKCDSTEGREPASAPNLPTPDFPLTDPNNYYRRVANDKAANFSSLTYQTSISGGLQDNSYYFLSGDITLQNMTANHVVIFVTGKLTVKTGVNLTNAILIGVNQVELKGNGIISSPLPYPVVISGGDVTKSNDTLFGNIYASGKIDLNPVTSYGSLIGQEIVIQGSSTYTDKYGTANYYALMPGFTYPPELKTTVTVSNSWSEVA